VLQLLHVLQQVSQHPHELRWNNPVILFHMRCKQDSSQQQLSQQLLQPLLQPPQEEPFTGAVATGATWVAGGVSPASQAVVTNKNAAFTRYPPTSRIDFGSGPWARPGLQQKKLYPTCASSISSDISEPVFLRAPLRRASVLWTLLLNVGCQDRCPLAILPEDLSMPNFPYIWRFSLKPLELLTFPGTPGVR
jgi:hypothetical protein